MTFNDVLSQTIAMLEQHSRVSFRALKRQFDIDDDYLEDLKEALLYAHPQVVDDGQGLIWSGETSTPPETISFPASTPTSPPVDGQSQEPASYTPQHLAEKILTSRSALEGERKQVTVMFCDLVNSTALAERIGPEAMHTLLNRFFELALDDVHRYEGTINQFLGDGFMALFGAPIAHEDHARRSVLAALALQRTLQDHHAELGEPYGVTCQFRMGINSGIVVVGSIGDNLRMDYSAIGDTTNLASRLQGIAEPGEILVSESMSRLVDGYVRLEDLPSVQVKGKTEPVAIYKAIGTLARPSPITSHGERTLSQFVGRERELAVLDELFEQVESGNGQVVGIVAEAGTGKSRLLYEFRQRLQDKQAMYLEGRCLSYGSTIPYHPIVDVVRNNCGITEGDSSETILDKVRSALQEVEMAANESAPYLLQLLGVKESAEPIAILTPEAVRTRTFETLKQMSLKGSQQRPLVIEIEDLHWIDKTSEDYLTSLVESLPGNAILLLTTYRPGYQPVWLGKSYATQISLHSLMPQDGLTIVHSSLHGKKLPEHLEQTIIEKAEGNPFFLEELTRAVTDYGDFGAETTVPDTIQGVLMARIDRLPEEPKRLLQMASVLGRAFSPRLLEAIWEGSDSLDSLLVELKRLEFLFERTEAEEPTYVFKHALTQDVAYDSLLLATRRRLHQQISEAILAQNEDNLEEWVSLLAHHFMHSDDPSQALPYLVRTGERAQRVYANVEALRAFTQALEILDALPTTETMRRQRTDLTLRLASLHALLGHYSESLALYARALEEVEANGDTKAIARLETRIGRVRYSMGDNEGATTCFQRALDLAQDSHDATRVAVCYQSLGDVYFTSGSLPNAIESFMNALHISEQAGNQAGVAAACTFLCNAHGRAGNLKEAVRWGRRALRIGEQLHDDRRIAWACIMLAQAYAFMGEFTETDALRERALHLCEKVGDFRGISWAQGKHYLQAEHEKDFEAGFERSKTMIQMGQESGGFQHEVSASCGIIAGALVGLGRYREAFDYCHRGLAISLNASNKLEYGRAYMVLAEIHASEAYRDWDKAAWHLEESLKAFREVGAKVDVGRAHLSGARIAVQRQDGSARQWAETAMDIFAERGANALLRETEELLEELTEEPS